MRALIVVVLMVVAACGSTLSGVPLASEDTARRDVLASAVRDATPGDTIDLRAVLGADWDRAVFMGPYSDSSVARDLLGFDFDLSMASPWLHTEGGMVVVLARGSVAVAWFAVPTETVGLHCLNLEVIPWQEATMTVVDEDGRFRDLAASTADCAYLRSTAPPSSGPVPSAVRVGAIGDVSARFTDRPSSHPTIAAR